RCLRLHARGAATFAGSRPRRTAGTTSASCSRGERERFLAAAIQWHGAFRIGRRSAATAVSADRRLEAGAGGDEGSLVARTGRSRRQRTVAAGRATAGRGSAGASRRVVVVQFLP